MSDNIKHSEPLIRISKRDGLVFWKSWLVRVIAVALALVLCSVIIVAITGYNPLQVYSAMIRGSFGTARKFWIMLQNLAMLLCISLAVTPAFKMRFWNIGAEGQVLVGGLATAAVMFYAGDRLPSFVMILIMLVSSIAASVIWAVIPAFFKAKWNTNETLFTLMMNYVAIQLVSFFIMLWVPSGSNVMGIINQGSKAGGFPKSSDQKYLLNIIIVAVLTAVMFVYLSTASTAMRYPLSAKAKTRRDISEST